MLKDVYAANGRLFINYAHRGASEYAPENTMSAFELCLEQNANGIETDVRISGDGVLYLFHDNDLDRVTDGSGPVMGLSFDQLRRVNVFGGSGSFAPGKIQSLAEFLDFAKDKDVQLAIEIKEEGIEESLIEAIAPYNIGERTVITSFRFPSIRKISEKSNLRVGYLVKELNDEVVGALRAINGYQICPNVKDVSVDSVKKLKDMGFSVRAWGIKTPQEMEKAYRSGVDGMTVNFPDKLYKLVCDGVNF
jgi:glycerophosphoryl diester phosphodiesterase